MNACSVCDARIDPHGRDGTRCARCKEPCGTCGGDVMLCSHPLPVLRALGRDLRSAGRDLARDLKAVGRDIARDIRRCW